MISRRSRSSSRNIIRNSLNSIWPEASRSYCSMILNSLRELMGWPRLQQAATCDVSGGKSGTEWGLYKDLRT